MMCLNTHFMLAWEQTHHIAANTSPTSNEKNVKYRIYLITTTVKIIMFIPVLQSPHNSIHAREFKLSNRHYKSVHKKKDYHHHRMICVISVCQCLRSSIKILHRIIKAVSTLKHCIKGAFSSYAQHAQ